MSGALDLAAGRSSQTDQGELHFPVLHGWVFHTHRYTCYPRSPSTRIALILHPCLHDRFSAAAGHAYFFAVQEVFGRRA